MGFQKNLKLSNNKEDETRIFVKFVRYVHYEKNHYIYNPDVVS